MTRPASAPIIAPAIRPFLLEDMWEVAQMEPSPVALGFGDDVVDPDGPPDERV
jgi:hypothetical protein